MMRERTNIMLQMDPFVGKYFSVEYVRKEVLMQTEKEYKELSRQMKKEIDAGLTMDPVDTTTFDTMDRQNDAMTPEIETAKAEDDMERQLKIQSQQPKPSNNNK
jgi:hypothetical protein